jgi:antitoxin MazE
MGMQYQIPKDILQIILSYLYLLAMIHFVYHGLKLSAMKSQIGQWGNSLAIRIPKYVVEALDLKPNDPVECTLEEGKLIVQRMQTLPELTLEELLAGITDPPESEVDWGRAMGNEVW